jgi:hypothetical protein
MTRRLFGLLAVALLVSPSFAQEKPKRIAVAEPKEVKDDADFAVQGEYEGEAVDEGKKHKDGVQVIAKGSGKFAVKLMRGGLPGAGWNEKEMKHGTAETKDGKTVVSIKEKDLEITGTLTAGELFLTNGDVKMTLKKVERKSPTVGAEPPKGAVVLFGKEGDETNWTGGKLVELSDGKFLNNGVKSKQAFGAFSAHVEFRLPWMPNSTGQGRGNSGVYLQDRYECQVLDSFGLKGENNECGGFYTLHKPKVNMCLPPLVWQTYDIDFTPAVFEGGKKAKNARATVKHNGVVIHDDVELSKATGGGQEEKDTPGVLQFQNHGDPVVFRNVWVVEKK